MTSRRLTPVTTRAAAHGGRSTLTTEDVISWDQGADGIVTLTLDDPTQRANTMTEAYRKSMHAAVERLRSQSESITGVILTSAKDTFFAGGDLAGLRKVTDDDAEDFAAGVAEIRADLRTLETLDKPVVAALNGAALGGGLEIALACHHRIALDEPAARFGLPEVSLGLMPGGGGVARVTRLLGVTDGLSKVLLTGASYSPAEAVALGLVDELAATRTELLARAVEWIEGHPTSTQRWDVEGYRIPGGTPSSPALAALMPSFPANLSKQLRGAPTPAPHHILAAAIEGAEVDLDTALIIENRYFVDIVRGQVAKNMITAFWFDMNSIKRGASRPAGHDQRLTRRVAVIGAGRMGAGIAYVSALSGIDVVLKDVTIEAAERGKAYSRALVDKAVTRGRLTERARDEVLARITPTDDYLALGPCDLVIEAVFESATLKHQIFADVQQSVDDDCVLASNTSTLPITDLATHVRRSEAFIGLHFFSPVERMPLLEIIRGRQTSDETLARALDFASQIGKTPIVVNDSRGFFTSRVFRTFINEALAMLGEGIAPATIEQATTQAGYPVGALQLADELTLDLMAKIGQEERTAAGDAYVAHPAEAVVATMIALGRPGRQARAGFFDYDADGRRTRLWTGLADTFPPAGDPATVDVTQVYERLLFIESLEAARCVEEGVVLTTADANIGSILGIGFPAWTGGVLQFINGYADPLGGSPGHGAAAFVARADTMAQLYGDRFLPTPLLERMAENDKQF